MHNKIIFSKFEDYEPASLLKENCTKNEVFY